MTVVMAVAGLIALGVLRRRGVLARSAFEPARRDVDALGAAAWAGVAVLAWVGWFLGAQIAAGAGGVLPGDDSLRARAIVMLGMYAGGVGALGVIWPLVGARLIKGGFRIGWGDLPRGAGALLLAVPILWVVSQGGFYIASWVASVRGDAPPDMLGHVTLSALVGGERDIWWWLVVVSVVVGAPIVEEIIWRGGVQSALRRIPGLGGWGAIFGAAALFTLMHLGDAAPHTLPTIFALAVAIGVVFERTGRLGAAICMHAGFNALNVAIALAQSG